MCATHIWQVCTRGPLPPCPAAGCPQEHTPWCPGAKTKAAMAYADCGHTAMRAGRLQVAPWLICQAPCSELCHRRECGLARWHAMRYAPHHSPSRTPHCPAPTPKPGDSGAGLQCRNGPQGATPDFGRGPRLLRAPAMSRQPRM